jgi:membrane-bound serine protease (ClpP class)
VRPLAVLLRIDTPGGRVDSMQRIVDAVMNDARVPVLAVVENAFSAGALIAMAAEQLAMLPGASIGAALPISVGVGGTQPVDEKFTSAVRGQFRSVAEARGRDAAVAEAMVDPAREIPGLSARGELVTLSADEAVDQNIADLVASDVPDALSAFGYGGVPTVVLERNLTERLGTLLAGPIVAGVLLILGIGGLVIEFFSPGFGIPGAIGIVALALFATSAFVATPAGILDVLLILGGVLLLALEAFVIPGFGVAGVLGMAAIVAAVIRIFQDDAITVLATTAIGGGLLLGVLLWLLPNTGLGRQLTLSERIGGGMAGAGAGAAGGGEAAPIDPARAKLVADRSYLIGHTGTALSDLRPAGVARFGDERVDVVSDGDYVAAGSRLRVLRAEGNRVVVRPLEPSSPAPSPSEDG